METWSKRAYSEAGVPGDLVQDNLSLSRRGVLRGLHLQNPRGQGKLVYAIQGTIFDVAVDVRVGSETFGHWESFELSAENHRQVYIPPGFAHGFCVVSETALFAYKCSDYYAPEYELGIHYADPALAIDWPSAEPLVSARDAGHPNLADVEEQKLPRR
jgi:dTDP-4-dehydrorhamnose 3,5-epimerase